MNLFSRVTKKSLLFVALALVLAFAATPSARADAMSLYNVSGMFSNGQQLSGQISVNSFGIVTAYSLNLSGASNTASCSGLCSIALGTFNMGGEHCWFCGVVPSIEFRLHPVIWRAARNHNFNHQPILVRDSGSGRTSVAAGDARAADARIGVSFEEGSLREPESLETVLTLRHRDADLGISFFALRYELAGPVRLSKRPWIKLTQLLAIRPQSAQSSDPKSHVRSLLCAAIHRPDGGLHAFLRR